MEIVAFDTETTGLVTNVKRPVEKQPKIVELSAIRFRVKDGKPDILSTFEGRFDPGEKLSKEVKRVTGISDNDLKGRPSFSDGFGLSRDVFEGADCVTAHNLVFDMMMVELEAERRGKSWDFLWPKMKICTVEASRFLKGRDLKLIDLHKELFGEGFSGAHGSMADTEALMRCFSELHIRGLV